MQEQTLSTRDFILSLLGLCLFYLGFEFFFNAFAMLTVDEFWFAHRIFQYKNELPYRDFAPYKTVLGYYILLIPMLFSHGIIQTLILTKNAIAVLNALILFFSSWWLTRFFSRTSIIAALIIIIFAEIVLTYSTNIRVDLLGYWFCFFSIFFILENHFLLAGFFLGLGFATSQKSVWYIFATECALAVQWFLISYRSGFFTAKNKTYSFNMFRNLVVLNVTIACVIGLYILLWSLFSDWQTVIKSIFYEAAAMYHLDWYNSARKLFWTNIILYNPLLFLLSPLALMSVCVSYEGDKYYYQRLFIVTYTFVILSCLIPYKQVFPYYMQVIIPVFFLSYTAFFSWLFAIFTHTPRVLIGKSALWFGLLLYLLGIVVLASEFELPEIYLLICLIPLLLGCYITGYEQQSSLTSLYFNLLCICMIFIGGIYPLTLFGIKLIDVNGGYQKANIRMINALLQDGSEYVAGIELIYNKTQPIPGIRHLMGPAIDYLVTPTEKLRSVMLASLYEDPNATSYSVIAALQKSSVKFYVNNYRMMGLPENIKDFLDSQYSHWWGSIYLYAPKVLSGTSQIMIKFAGQYSIETTKKTTILLDHHPYAWHSIVTLTKGMHASYSTNPYRLKLVMHTQRVADPRYEKDDSNKLIF